MSNRVLVTEFYSDDNVTVKAERLGDILAVHATLEKSTKKALATVVREVRKLVEFAQFLGYEKILTYTQDERLPSLLPEAVRVDPITYNGKNYEVYKWEKQSQ